MASALLFEAKPDRERLMLDEDQMSSLEGHGHFGLDPSELPLDSTGRDKLPDPEITQVELIEEPLLVKGIISQSDFGI